jgi:phosphocarrier protein HPr
MISTKITIINKLGLHARAAAKLVGVTTKFSAKIRVGTGERMIDAKSIMSVMMLAAAKGTELELECDGDDEQSAHAAVITLINNRFDETE